MFTVAIEPKHHLMRIAVTGFCSASVMPPYLAELRRQTDALMNVGGCRRILVNMLDYPVQARPIAEAHARIITHGKRNMRARTAVVMASSLLRLQAMRVAGLETHEMFEDEPSARGWLLSA